IFLETGEDRSGTADGTGGARRALDATAVVVGGSALARDEKAREHNRGTQHRAWASLVAIPGFLLDLVETRTTPAAVGVFHRVGEIRVVTIHRVDDGNVALTDFSDARGVGIVRRGKARDGHHALRVFHHVAFEGFRGQILSEAQLG